MLLIAFEPAFSGKILKKLDKELKKVNDPFFLIICIVIKSFSYIQMGLKKLQNFLADIGENAVEIGNNAMDIDNNAMDIGNNATWTMVSSYHVVLSLQLFVLFSI